MENIEKSLNLFVRLSKENKFKDSSIIDEDIIESWGFKA